MFTLGGKHDDQIENLLKQLQTFIEFKSGKKKIGLHHVVYYTAKFTLYHIVGKTRNWKDVLDECIRDTERNDEQFKQEVRRILDELKSVVAKL